MSFDLPKLPENWTYQPLAACALDGSITYGVVQPGTAQAEGVPLVRVNNFRDGRIDLTDLMKISPEVESKYSRTRLRGGEVLLTLVGSVGQVAIVQDGLAGFNVARAVGVIDPIPEIGPEWVSLCLRSPLSQRLLNSRANTTVQTTINLKDVRALPIPIPPTNVRDEIARVIFALDNRIALLRETNATLEAIAQALFKSWFVDFDPVHARAEGREPDGLDADTAALFPDGFEESALGLVPRGWKVLKFAEFIARQSVGKKYDQKSALSEGEVPILDQGKSGIIGFHNDEPGVKASLDKPVVVFANHTCYMRLITFDFSAIQNVLPFTGKGVDTVWAFYATKDRVNFSEYKGHWPDFAIERAVVPDEVNTLTFHRIVDSLVRSMRNNELQAQSLASIRDTLLPRLISGQLRLPEAEAMLKDAA
ncbi:UNVERIFIED_ORG: type I restriction enzyme S subunit [Paraburkholderia sediminicola]|nr:type I restriction enzyme S subunit [Paraburkholderia sediminicola]